MEIDLIDRLFRNRIYSSSEMLDIFIDLFFVFFHLASRQIRRRVPYAGHLITPRRLWLNKIPTLCDVVIEFPGYYYSQLKTISKLICSHLCE